MTLQAVLVMALLVFAAGLGGVLARQRFSVAIMSLWMMFLSAAIAAVAFARWNLLPDGKVLAIVIAISGVIVVLCGFSYFVIDRKNCVSEKRSVDPEVGNHSVAENK